MNVMMILRLVSRPGGKRVWEEEMNKKRNMIARNN